MTEPVENRELIKAVEQAESDRQKRAEKMPQERRMELTERLRAAEMRALEDEE